MTTPKPRASSRRSRESLSQHQNFEEAPAHLGAFLGDVYNVKRLHSSLGCLLPVGFEAAVTD